MTSLRIPSEQTHGSGHGRPAQGASTALRAGWRWVQRALIGCALVLFVGLAVLPALGLYRPVTVLSGSMRPTFSPGDVVIDVPEPISAVRVGQVISYHVPVGIRQIETHRVVKIRQGTRIRTNHPDTAATPTTSTTRGPPSSKAPQPGARWL